MRCFLSPVPDLFVAKVLIGPRALSPATGSRRVDPRRTKRQRNGGLAGLLLLSSCGGGTGHPVPRGRQRPHSWSTAAMTTQEERRPVPVTLTAFLRAMMRDPARGRRRRRRRKRSRRGDGGAG